MSRSAAALVLAAAMPLISGCIAAVVPLAAGAALVRSQTDAEGSHPAEGAVVIPLGTPPPGEPVLVAAATPAGALRDGAAALPVESVTIERTNLTELPAPLASSQSGVSAMSAFARYAQTQVEAQQQLGKLASALLSRASDLRVERAACGNQPPAVFVDLDPGRDTFDPLAVGAPLAPLGPVLGRLRQQGVRVVWFSRLGSNFAAATRAALASGGLDPAGADELALLRDIGERKQSLRDAVAKRLCPIAIIGDERADFDELYLYLKDPASAVQLDAMIGQGWFIASPFAATPAGNADIVP